MGLWQSFVSTIGCRHGKHQINRSCGNQSGTVGIAAPITIPAGLNSGDQYWLVFVTTDTIVSFGNPNIATYNNLVTTAANSVTVLVALGTNWNAVGSTSSVDARDNTGTNPTVDTGVPIYLSNGTKLVDNSPYFWGGLITSPMDIT